MQLISVRSRKQEQESRLCSYDLEETWTNDSSTSSMRSNNDNAEDEKEQGGGVHDVKLSRVPLSLQKVFVDSWDGIEVKEAPVEASKTFNSPRNQRSWSFHVSLKGIVSKDKQESNIPAATKGTVRIGFRRSASKIVSPPIEEPIQPIVPKKPKVRHNMRLNRLKWNC